MNISNVTAKSNNLVGDASTTSKSKEQGNNFSSFLNNITNNITKTSDRNLDMVVNKTNTQDITKDKTQVVNNTVSDKVKNVVDKNVKEDTKVADTDMEEIEDMEDEEVTADILAQLAQIIENLLTTINETISEEMEVSVEDLTMVFEKLDISIADLFDPNKIKEILTTLAGDDDMALVANEDMMNLFGDIMENIKQTIGELADSLDMPVSEIEDMLNRLDINVADLSKNKETKIDELISNVLDNVNDEPLEELDNTSDSKLRVNEDGIKDNIIDNTEETLYKVKTDNTNNNDNFKEHNDDSKQSFMSNLTESVTKVVENVINTEPESAYQKTQTSLDIINQILDVTKVKGLEKGGSIELTLTPETLGKVNLSVVVKEGVMTASITAQTESAKDAIAANIEVLKENLNNQGIKVEEVSVAVASHNLEQNLEEKQKDNGFLETKKDKVGKLIFDENGERIEGVGDGIELSPEEIRRRNPLELNNTRVNYFV